MDINQPITNPHLDAAMDTFLADGSPENEQAMLSAAQQAYFLAPAVISPSLPAADATGAVAARTETNIQFEMVSNQRNQHFFPAFTDWKQLRKWKDSHEQKTVVLQLKNYAVMLHTRGAGIVVNPFGQNLVFSRDHIFQMLNMATPCVMEKRTHIIFGEPAAWPEQLADTLKTAMREMPAISAAWLQLMVKGDEESFLMIVDAEGNIPDLFPPLGAAAKPALGPKEVLDMVPATEEFAQSIMENSRPFYRRDG